MTSGGPTYMMHDSMITATVAYMTRKYMRELAISTYPNIKRKSLST